jgi:16S rRNA (guanine527-N7)-methyltransferase
LTAVQRGAAAQTLEIQALCDTLGLLVTPNQVTALGRYLDLLQHWNAAYNLTAVRDRPAMLSHHLADCLAIAPALQRWQCEAGPQDDTLHVTRVLRVLDVGSGGGLPGVVLAVLWPQWQVSCVDAVGKKAAFVRQVAGALPLPNLLAVHSRIEALRGPGFQLIMSRAFATLADFVRLSRPSLAPSGVWLAMKGKRPDDEIEALPSDVQVFHVEQLAVPGLDAQRCLVWMRPSR